MEQTQRSKRVGQAVRRRSEYLVEAFRPPGVRLRRKVALPDRTATARLVDSPVFVMSSQRSGSTLLRVLLNSHSRIRAPHELHLDSLQVGMGAGYLAPVMDELGLARQSLEHLLWDGVLDHELRRSGKSVIVDKTPSNADIWRRISQAWPNARYLFLLRHPGSVLESMLTRHADFTRDRAIEDVLSQITAVDEARRCLDGLTVRYEELTADPERETRRICGYLGVLWEPEMLDYGKQEHGPFKPYFGDWSENIASGRVQRARPLPAATELPEPLRAISRTWGYVS
ncbi:sulfotransferase family protein [Streptacidiphilus carbonis]|jgi:hypothetical protein|uniref:sulfotransferase family protein n=1 Tax=Streptacidiphilus carbonis TaxID=105422 RepID=UPI0007C855DC|nr:sulfotransferase [Streptacidiphilus carbonis]